MIKKLKSISSLWYYFIFTVLSALLVMLLMWAVYMIPIEKIKDNVYEAATSGFYEVYYANLSVHDAKVDNYTDLLMINQTVLTGHGTLRYALLNPYEIPTYLGGNHVIKYGRFWHAHLLFLKPLFVFFNLDQIKYLNLLLQVALLLVILRLMYRRLGINHCLTFLAALCFLDPVVCWQCLEYQPFVNIMLCATLWVLLSKNPDDKYMFYVVGTVSSLFFLVFPLLTLGVPLIVYICLYDRETKENIKCVIGNSLLWGGGFAAMLFCKWILASWLTEENILADGWQKVLDRMYGNTENGAVLKDLTYYNTLEKNIAEIWRGEFLYILGGYLLLTAILWWHQRYKLQLTSKSLIILGIGLMPFVWYALVMQHSFVHPFFTYRILTITVYAVLTALICCLRPKARQTA